MSDKVNQVRTFEVLTATPSRRSPRQWSDDEKARLVAEAHLIGLRDNRGHLFRVDHDVLAVLDLETFHLIITFDGFFRFGVNKLAPDPMSRRLVYRVKRDALRCGNCRIQAHGALEVADFKMTFPLCAMTSHDDSRIEVQR